MSTETDFEFKKTETDTSSPEYTRERLKCLLLEIEELNIHSSPSLRLLFYVSAVALLSQISISTNSEWNINEP